ncbi:hypothetical protein EG240_04945 [Paenimyroides tangerinum]|uniref:Outer membrane protein beta-barrel domain-containing protein n=1 Tax=Paenimyroides tangerinum TaxID=2488728 RepID=A0A3P3WBZ8_9FLAO|nr:hypothetical protein [Paenimyroides tangerinum]RRJ91908.1 hypothetical protein EG240_04945 [Paenimyroides tangerinum]
MYRIIIYISVFLASLLCKMYGQSNDSVQVEKKDNYFIFKESLAYNNEKKSEIFQSQINKISNQLDKSIKENKEALKKDLLLIEQQLKNNEISQEKAEVLKNEKAIFYANKIDEATLKSEKEINEAIQVKINNELDMKASLNDYIKSLVEKRSHIILSLGFGTSLNLVDGALNTDMYKTKPFSSIHFGVGGKTRLIKDNPHYYLRYEWTTIYNFVKPANQKVLDVVDNQTTLVDYEKPLKKSRIDFGQSRISAYFEYDFSKKKEDEYGNVILRSRQSYFMGIGGFAGYGNKKVTQIMKYKTSGKEHKNREIGAYGVNQFVYGVGAYFGYKKYSLFATYNLNPTFKNSEFKQNFLNIGINLDII